MKSRFEAPRQDDCDTLADLFLGSDLPAAAADSANRLELVVALHLADGRDRFTAHCCRHAAQDNCSVGCVEHVGAGWAADLLGPGSPPRSRRATVGKAIAHIAAHASRVCVLLPAHDEVGSLIAGLSDLAQPPDCITILCSTSEGDVVATYRQIKSISILCPQYAGQLTLAISGSDLERARSAADRIIRTARQFLSLELRCTVHVEEEPVYPDHHFDPHDPMQVSPDAYAPASPAHAAQQPPTQDRGLESLACDGTALSVRCPNAPDVVIAVDTNGRLHVIAATFAGPGWNACADALVSLALARAFASRHRGILSALDPRVSPGAPEPEAHLVVNHFADAAPILESGLRLHLATIIEVDGLRRFGASPLS